MNDRPRGIQVYPMPEPVSGPYEHYALLVREDGEMRMVHSEGVAYMVTTEVRWTWNDYSTEVPQFTKGELILIAVGVEPVDLADWIRVFGARLESNFAQISHWYNEARLCAEGDGIVNDDNPGRPICRTCDDDPTVSARYPKDA